MASPLARARVTTPAPGPRRLATLTNPMGCGRLDRTRGAAPIVGQRVVHRQRQQCEPEREQPGGEVEERPRLSDTGNRQRATCSEGPRNADAERTGHAAGPMVPEDCRRIRPATRPTTTQPRIAMLPFLEVRNEPA